MPNPEELSPETLNMIAQAEGFKGGEEMVTRTDILAAESLESISESLAEVDGEGDEEKVYTVVGELRTMNATLEKLFGLLEKNLG